MPREQTPHVKRVVARGKVMHICTPYCLRVGTEVLPQATPNLSGDARQSPGKGIDGLTGNRIRGAIMADYSIILHHESVQARFWSKVDRRTADECWAWRGTIGQFGYGFLSVKPSTLRAHRLSLTLATGDCGAGLCALHSCDNPSCVNPSHLRWGSHADNTRDKMDRNRVNRWHGRRAGIANCLAKLTDDAVRQIRSSREPQALLAERLGVTQGAISRVKTGSTWAHVKDLLA